MKKNLKVYTTRAWFCFACQKYFTPSIKRDVHQKSVHGITEEEIMNKGECPQCVAGFSPHRNCIMR